MKKKRQNAFLLGLGLDNEDGHKRITQSERFCIAGGSEETHGRMTETVVKTMEHLDNRGKCLDEVDPHELRDLLHRHTPA